MKKAATMVILQDNQILCASRRNSKYYGLVGGKSNENESAVDTAKRETYEECGVIVHKAKHIYTAQCGEFIVSTFLAEEFEGVPLPTEDGIDIQWLDKDVLVDSTTGAFPEYNAEVLKRI